MPMPVVEADFLKGVIDPSDRLHQASLSALKKVRERKWLVSSSAFLELDLLLKQLGIGLNERFKVFEVLKVEILPDRILAITPAVISQAVQLQGKYRCMGDFYFDSIHLATAILYDGTIVSSDRVFDRITEVKRISLSQRK